MEASAGLTPVLARLAVIGGGSWGTTVARHLVTNLAAQPVRLPAPEFSTQVSLWVYPEVFPEGGGDLAADINAAHENRKYLPGFGLPAGLVAHSDLAQALEGATHIVTAVPHAFCPGVFAAMAAHLPPASTVDILSLTKGVLCTDATLETISGLAARTLADAGHAARISVLSGATIAHEVAACAFTEATVASTDSHCAAVWRALLTHPSFSVRTSADPVTVEYCGAFKNVIALAVGLADGVGLSANTRAGLLRLGFDELRALRARTVPAQPVDTETYFESCGIADLFVTCIAGRNARAGRAFARDGTSWAEIERGLGDQRVEGLGTVRKVLRYLEHRGWTDDFPLFHTVADVVDGRISPDRMLPTFEVRMAACTAQQHGAGAAGRGSSGVPGSAALAVRGPPPTAASTAAAASPDGM